MALIDIRHWTLERSGAVVLRDVSLRVASGEILMIVGPSGSGKSSLLRCMNRLLEPAPGTVFLDGADITQLDVLSLRRRVGMVFQQPSMLPGTVADNVRCGPALRGETLDEGRVAELLALVSLDTALAGKPAAELSGGQAQRVSIARALANGPEVLLLDEPTSALDPIATHAVEETLLRLRAELGLTLVWVSHLVEQAQRVGDRAVLLDRGRVVTVDRVAAMFDPQHGDARALAFANGDEAGLERALAQTSAGD